MAKAVKRTPALEWAVGAIGAIVFLGMLAILASAGLRSRGAPPEVRTHVERVAAAGGGFIAEFNAENVGDAAAADVEIVATLNGAEQARARFAYLPPHSKLRGGVFLRDDPRAGRLQLRADGYAEP